jgi:hypothetical protein
MIQRQVSLFGHPPGFLVTTPARCGVYIFQESGEALGKYAAWNHIGILSVYFSKRKNAFMLKRRNGKTMRWVDQVALDPSLLLEVASVLYELGGTSAPEEEKKSQELSEVDNLIGELRRIE